MSEPVNIRLNVVPIGDPLAVPLRNVNQATEAIREMLDKRRDIAKNQLVVVQVFNVELEMPEAETPSEE